MMATPRLSLDIFHLGCSTSKRYKKCSHDNKELTDKQLILKVAISLALTSALCVGVYIIST